MSEALNESYVSLLTTLVRPMLAQPEDLEIKVTRRDNAVALVARMSPRDTGRVIGKGGTTIQNLRAVLELVAWRNRDRIALDIADA